MCWGIICKAWLGEASMLLQSYGHLALTLRLLGDWGLGCSWGCLGGYCGRRKGPGKHIPRLALAAHWVVEESLHWLEFDPVPL